MKAQDDDRNRSGPVDVWVGARLRALRQAAGLTQGQVGEALGLTEAAVRRFERAGQPISAARLWRLCELFGIEVSEFFEGLHDAVGRRGVADDGAPPVSRVGVEEGAAGTGVPTPSAITVEIAQLVNGLNPVQQAVLRDMVRGIGSGRRK